MAAISGPDWPDDSSIPLDVLDIDRAFTELARKAPRAAHLLELRYFAPCDEPSSLAGLETSGAEFQR